MEHDEMLNVTMIVLTFWLIVIWACLGKKTSDVIARLALAYILAILAYIAYTNKIFGVDNLSESSTRHQMSNNYG